MFNSVFNDGLKDQSGDQHTAGPRFCINFDPQTIAEASGLNQHVVVQDFQLRLQGNDACIRIVQYHAQTGSQLFQHICCRGRIAVKKSWNRMEDIKKEMGMQPAFERFRLGVD